MAKSGGTPDDIMTVADMKPLLMKSKKEPINCALAMSAEHEGVLLLHRRLKPKRLLANLRKEAKASKLELNNSSLRFGRAEVDTDTDATLVKFTLNKPAVGGAEAKFKLRLKGSGFSKVEFLVDEELENEAEDDEEQAAPSGAASAAPDAVP